MSSPTEALPPPIAKDAIQALLASKGLPKAISITPLQVTAEYHAIYRIALPAAESSSSSCSSSKDYHHAELILRISGRHLPVIKTRNEVGVMTWLRRNTSIPIPDIVAYDASEDNPIGHEYTLLSKAPGVPLSDVYADLTEAQATRILHQLIDYLVELHSFPWDGIGGLALEDDQDDGKHHTQHHQSRVVLSQVVDETFWQVADVTRFWSPSETIATLNIQGPYTTYVDLVCARIQQSSLLIQKHDSLAFMHDTLPRLDALVATLTSRGAADDSDLNRVALRLAHKDLHFANILVDPASDGTITAVLDWEFSGVVPFPEWNPQRSFLWNGKNVAASQEEKVRWVARFEECCRERGVAYILEDAEFASPLQESMNKIHNFLRAIVEVSPRGQRQDLVQGWKDTVLENLSLFGV